MTEHRMESLIADQAVRELHVEAAAERLAAQHRSLQPGAIRTRLAAALRHAADRLSPGVDSGREGTRARRSPAVAPGHLHGVR